MPTFVFPGGPVAGFPDYTLTPGYYLKQNFVNFPVIVGNGPDNVRRNLNGQPVVRIVSINPDGFNSGDSFPTLHYSGIMYTQGNIITFSSLSYPYCEIRISGSAPFIYFGIGFGQPGVEEWFGNFPNDQRVGSYASAIAGSWTWNTVPTAPAISTVLNGTSVTVTRGSSTSDNLGPITEYRVQRRESTNGTTWGGWVDTAIQSTTTFSVTYRNLTPSKFYQFRVYARNNAGFSEATTSGTVFITPMARHTGTDFTALSKLKRYDGSNWQNIAQAQRWNGTSWVPIDITGINST
jgi:hypothetical protein